MFLGWWSPFEKERAEEGEERSVDASCFLIFGLICSAVSFDFSSSYVEYYLT